MTKDMFPFPSHGGTTVNNEVWFLPPPVLDGAGGVPPLPARSRILACSV